MSVENPLVVDGLGIDRETGVVVLTVSDHLDWVDDRAHLQALQAKLNAYFDFVQSGQVYEAVKAADGTVVRIDVIGKWPVPDTARWFFTAAASTAEKNGFSLNTRQLPDGY